MKNKSTRHKESNTFKFQPFHERIGNINIDIVHKIGHGYEDQTDEEQCYFYQAVENWSILNLTEGFEAFKNEVKPNTLVTLPQLILNKDHVVQVLLKHLRLKNPLCVQPLLDIVVAVAKDLRKDFYPYYEGFLEVLIDLLNAKDPDQLEWTFTCLAYIFKFLWRPLLKDITCVFNTLLPLLSSNKPDYINNFASESFAFVARKVKDRHTFLSHILKTVKTRKDGVEGCGKLFFEVIHGVSGQFHSCAETVLPFLVESLCDPKYPQAVLFEILEQVVANVVMKIEPQKSDLFWNCLLNILENLESKWKVSPDLKVANDVELILKLLGQGIEYRNGKLLQNHVLVIHHIGKLLNNENFPESVLLTLTKIGILLLLCKNIRLTQEQASKITRSILALPRPAVLLYFVDNISTLSSFEALVLPAFLKHCLAHNLNTDSFTILTQLILKKSPLSESGINLLNWVKYPIDFNGKGNNLKIEEALSRHIADADFENATNYVCSLICLPHLNLSDAGKFGAYLIKNTLDLVSRISRAQENDDKSVVKRLLFLLNNTVECVVHLSETLYSAEHFDLLIATLLPLTRNKDYVCALKVVDLLVTVFRDDEKVIKMTTLEKLDEVLAPNFSSPYREVRLISTHVYTLFENLSEFDLKHSSDPEVVKQKWDVFSICYRIESIESHIQTYRDQLQNLEKLNFDKPQMIMCSQTRFKSLPLRYLCGVLYINFKLLWEPVLAIIDSHAHGLEVNEFWNVYGEELRKVAGNIREEQEHSIDTLATDRAFLTDLYARSHELGAKPDFVNYRLLLWKAMSSFADVAEMKTRDISGLLLDFIQNEYTKSNSDIALMWNIKQNASREVLEENDDENEDEKQQEQEESLPKSKKSGGKASLQALQGFLSVFSKVRSPKSMYRESELNKLYFELVQHRNQQVQKAALDCIMTYKYKYLTPYKTNLYNLVDDKTFKDEVAAFRIDKDSGVVEREHRQDLIPLVMRIVFSKMSVKTGMRTAGKSSGQFRRNLIFRFLAGCEEKDMLTFLHMAFRYYTRYLHEDPEVTVETLSGAITLEKFIPPKRLLSTINLLNVAIEQFGGLMSDELLTFVLQIVLVVGTALREAFLQVSDVHSGYLAILRNLRASSLKIVERFFGQFDRYPWTNRQINAIFAVFVWPYLDKLNTEGIHSPTALLKLFAQWSSNPRYFPLLVKHDGGGNRFILPRVVELLLNEKCNVTVVNVIEEMIEKLLSLEVDTEDLQLAIPVDNLLPVEDRILNRADANDKLNYGSCILLPHVPSILKKIKGRLETKSKTLNRRELFILSRISELIWEANVSDSTLKLLLPVVLKKCTSNEHVVNQFLTTVHNLIGNVANPQAHLRQISPLFGEVSHPSGRRSLSQILKLVCGDNLSVGWKLVDGLNAWDAKWVDQPDFQRRHDTFKDIHKAIEEGAVDIQVGILIVYNCFFLLNNEKDLALRESSSHCLKRLCCHLIEKYKNTKEIDYVLNETLLMLIRRGMKSRNGDFRQECILLLGHLARECPESHPVLRDLHRYTNKADLEVDFFENITHLQLHRHARALLKFCQITRELTSSPNVRTLTQFILPFASFYLCSEKYSSKNSIIDAAIECIATSCRMLSWHQYEGLLKFYLGELQRKLDYQKQLVRVTVAILDAFHFDLSKAQLSEEVPEEIPPLDKESDENREDATSADETVADLHVDDALELGNNEIELEEEEEEIKEGTNVKEVKICEKTSVLCKSTATRIIRTIQVVLLPQLHKALAELTHHETSHKINRKKTSLEREDEDLLRVPISLALVKLLQRLPKKILLDNLPGIFMKSCTFLKSHLESVRRATREILQKIMQTLGPQYLYLLLEAMTPLLSRGFQVHVLVFTVHAVLNCLRDSYEPADMDRILLTVIDLCKADLFGSLSEEKEVAKIAVKTSEAKSTKSFDTLQILAQYVTDKCLMDLILPIKNVLQNFHSYKTVFKAQECLRYIALGLVDNSFIPVESLIKFAYGTASESIPELVAGKDGLAIDERETEKVRREKRDCFIISEQAVGRPGARQNRVKSSSKTNAHLLIEFGLRVCFVLLKRDKLRNDDYRPFLDPFVAIFKNCLNSKHIKLSTLTLHCLSWIMRFELPSMREHVADITRDIFAILHKYASAGLSKGDNFDLVGAAFKAMTTLVRDVKFHTIDTEQLKVLLLYAEQDMHDHDRQATAFNLLKAIIARKLIVPEIHEVMEKVASLSITSELNYVRAQSRMVFHQYVVDYPLGDKLEKHLSFYLSQMSYELQYGRESAIEMIQILTNSFPMKVLKEHSGTLLIMLGARLVNDEAPECRKMVAECLSSMLTRLSKADREPLFDVIVLWLKDNNASHRQLAAQLCGIFVSVEKSAFEVRLPKLMPLILKQFGQKDKTRPGRSVRKTEGNDESSERIKDHFLFQVLQMLLKICALCPSFLKSEQIRDLAKHVQALLGYPHEWVRLAAAQFIGFVLSTTDIERLASLLASDTPQASEGYLHEDPVDSVKSLTLDLCDQLQPGNVKSDLAEQVIKNLVFIARLLEKVPIGDGDRKVNLLWLTKRMRKIVNTEVVEAPTSTVLRTEVFKWIGGMGAVLSLDSILLVLNHLLAPLLREMITTEESNAPLRQLSKEVGSVLKQRVGMEVYTTTLTNLQQTLSVKRAERKRTRTQLAVTDPETFAKKKIKRHEKKKESRKRKISERKGGKKSFKKRKLVDLEPTEEIL